MARPTLFTLTLGSLILGTLLAAASPARAAEAAYCRVPVIAPGSSVAHPPVCMDAFYEVLAEWGTWVETDRYGMLFCPDPGRFDADFRPFAEGHWVMTEAGWTFVGDHPTSWITDHYGRWVEPGLSGCAFGWVPGDVWSPAWVEFHVGENTIGWQPAPFDGVPVQLHVPAGTRLQAVRLLGAPAPPSRNMFVAVPDGDFAHEPVQEVVLSGPALYAALRDSVLLPDARAGLHSQERLAVVAQMLEARGLRASAGGAGPGTLSGEAPEPAVRISAKGKRGKPGVAGTLRKGEGAGATAPRTGDNPANTGKVYWGGNQNNGGFTQPGPQGGVPVLQWGKPKQNNLPPAGTTPPPVLNLAPPASPPPSPPASTSTPTTQQ